MWNLEDQSRTRENTNRHKKKAKRCSEDGWSPLHVAALRGDVSAIHAILKRDPDMIKCVTSKTKSTALHFAAISGNVNAVQALLAHCFSDEAGLLLSRSHPVSPDQGGWLFPMERDLAESFGAMELCRNSQQGYLALDLAIISADEGTVDVLLAAHRNLVLSSPSASSSSGGGDSEISTRYQKEQGFIHIPIHYVEPDILVYTTRRQDLAMLSKLLEHGASTESWCDPDTLMRPLHWAAAMGSVPVVSLLLQRGADPLSRTREGLTASDLVQSLHPENESLLALLDQCSEI